MHTETTRSAGHEAQRHPDPVDLIALARGVASTRDRRRWRHHCLVCEDCALQLRALIALRDGHGRQVAAEALDATRGLTASKSLVH